MTTIARTSQLDWANKIHEIEMAATMPKAERPLGITKPTDAMADPDKKPPTPVAANRIAPTSGPW